MKMLFSASRLAACSSALLAFTVFLSAPTSFAFESTEVLADSAVAPITRYFEVAPGLTRGARPTLEGLKFLARNGVKTIVNLEDDPQQAAWEQAEAAKLGMNTVSTPMSGFWRPQGKQVQRTLAAVNDHSLYPLFVHCKHGEDRTGLIIGLHRVFTQGWQPSEAYAEMRGKGFHPALFMLDQYFIDSTGYNPHPAPAPQD